MEKRPKKKLLDQVRDVIRLKHFKDIDFEQNQIVVRDGKGMNDRVTVLSDR